MYWGMDSLKRTESSDVLFSVKMRSSSGGRHVSGAERFSDESGVCGVVSGLAARALSHERGTPDMVNIRVESVPRGEVVHIPALKVRTERADTPQAGIDAAARLLLKAGVADPGRALEILRCAGQMRGAMILDARTLERLEPDFSRGVRVTNMDSSETHPGGVSSVKNHFSEALVLASKTASAPGIIAEFCVSDDPGYVTGYVASRDLGYVRIEKLKEYGDSRGGRIFFYDGPKAELDAAIRYLEQKCVVVDGVPPYPDSHVMKTADENAVAELDMLRRSGLYRECAVSESCAGPRGVFDGRECLVLCSNDYLDLARDSRVVSAAEKAAGVWGAGTGGARLTTGTQVPHVELERRLAALKGKDSAVLFNSGYTANAGVIQAYCGREDAVFSDELNHASIIDGCRLSRASVAVYRHCRMDDLERLLAQSSARRKLVVTDSVFSMDGDMAPLPEIMRLARRYGAAVMIDEAHATGVVGAGGRGVCEHFGLEGDEAPEFVMGTLSKALGSAGGFVCCSAVLADLVRNRARTFIFSTSLPASAAAAADAALDVMMSEPWRVSRVRENAEYLASALESRGVVCGGRCAAIIPVPAGGEEAAVLAARRLASDGILVSAIRYPSVALGAARLRCTVMCSHTHEELDFAAEKIAGYLVGGG